VAEKMDVAGSGYAFRINNGRDACRRFSTCTRTCTRTYMGGRKMGML
jgi:hypothetical protein